MFINLQNIKSNWVERIKRENPISPNFMQVVNASHSFPGKGILSIHYTHKSNMVRPTGEYRPSLLQKIRGWDAHHIPDIFIHKVDHLLTTSRYIVHPITSPCKEASV